MKTVRLSIPAKVIIFIAITEFLIMLFLGRPKVEAFLDVFILAVIISFVLNVLLGRPLNKIFKVMEEAGKGNLEVSLDLKQSDEMGRLAENFNQMLLSLKSAQDDITRKSQFIETIAQGVAEELMLLDAGLKVLWANRRVIRDSEIKIGGALRDYCYKAVCLKDECSKEDEEVCLLNEARRTKKSAKVVHAYFDKKGNKCYAEVSIYPILDSGGEIIQFIHSAYDISEKINVVAELKSAKAAIEWQSSILEDKITEKTRDLALRIKQIEEHRRAIINILGDVNQARNELSESNKQLKETQAKLIQTAKMVAIGQLVGGIAHEINNPLTGVLNNVQLLKMELETRKDVMLSEFKELLDIIEDSGLRCKRITQELLDFSRIQKKGHKVIDINEVLDKTINLAQYEIKLDNVKITKELAESQLGVMAEPVQLQQVFLNILNNARWAVRNKQEPQIKIKTAIVEDSRQAVIEIADNGCGIEKENLAHIFEPFFTTKQVGEGTGLGLSICYGIIKEHNGAIEVESEGKDKGVTFRIALPLG